MPTYLPLSDFNYFYAASLCMQRGVSPFNQHEMLNSFLQFLPQSSIIDGTFRSLPFMLWLCWPLAFLSYPVAATIWTLCTVLAYTRTIVLLKNWSNCNAWLAIVPALLFFPFIKTVYFGQVSALILWALCESLLAKKDSLGRGLIFSVCIIKINIFLPLVAYLLGRRNYFSSINCLGLLVGFSIQAVALLVLVAHPLDSFLTHDAGWITPESLNQPTVSALLIFYLHCVPAVKWIVLVGTVLLAIVMSQRKQSDDNETIFLTVIPASILGTPYLWSHDLVYLLPCWLASLMKLHIRQRFFMTILLLTLGTYCVIVSSDEEYMIFLPLILFINTFRRPNLDASAAKLG